VPEIAAGFGGVTGGGGMGVDVGGIGVDVGEAGEIGLAPEAGVDAAAADAADGAWTGVEAGWRLGFGRRLCLVALRACTGRVRLVCGRLRG
jgi:hypothetical protein